MAFNMFNQLVGVLNEKYLYLFDCERTTDSPGFSEKIGGIKGGESLQYGKCISYRLKKLIDVVVRFLFVSSIDNWLQVA